ncbi:MAG: hypothetical protein NWE89_10045 [Candidatus Bathyarchaeota archaeon]|nr:hypothetical protein [Candidatus Bathyarchaeota archaeon]
MPTLKVKVKTGYGEIEVTGESPEELLEGLSWLSNELVAEINGKVVDLVAAHAEDNLHDIIRLDKDGPTIVTTEELSHYESIGLLLYAMKNYQAKSKEIRERLVASGKKVTVAARLHEMRDRGQLFKPNSKGSVYKLTSKGVKWIEDDILPKLKKDV